MDWLLQKVHHVLIQTFCLPNYLIMAKYSVNQKINKWTVNRESYELYMFESQLPEKIWLSAILKAFDNGTNMAHAERVIMPKGAKKR